MTPHIGAFREHGKKPSKYAGSFKFRAGLIIAGTILVLALGHLLLVGGGV
jgi:hypothetical protein